jgi:hypothetical protein
MRKISVTIINNNIHVIPIQPEPWDSEEGVCIDFFLKQENVPAKELIPIIRKFSGELKWISWKANKTFIDFTLLKQEFPELFHGCNWMVGNNEVQPEFDNEIETSIPIVSFCKYKEEFELESPKKIFLSHKGSNKDYVKNYYEVLKEVGFEPWLDDEDMPAGSKLSRSILKGFQESCACVFFITPEFKDESYLADEIDYAIMQNRKRGDKFRIITLQFEDEDGKKGSIPDMLEIFVWKTPKNEFQALKQIFRALPIKAGIIEWKKS